MRRYQPSRPTFSNESGGTRGGCAMPSPGSQQFRCERSLYLWINRKGTAHQQQRTDQKMKVLVGGRFSGRKKNRLIHPHRTSNRQTSSPHFYSNISLNSAWVANSERQYSASRNIQSHARRTPGRQDLGIKELKYNIHIHRIEKFDSQFRENTWRFNY